MITNAPESVTDLAQTRALLDYLIRAGSSGSSRSGRRNWPNVGSHLEGKFRPASAASLGLDRNGHGCQSCGHPTTLLRKVPGTSEAEGIRP